MLIPKCEDPAYGFKPNACTKANSIVKSLNSAAFSNEQMVIGLKMLLALKPGFHLDFLCLSLLVLAFYCPFWFF